MSTDTRITDLYFRWLNGWQRGEDTPAEELCKAHPQLLAQLRQAIADEKKFDARRKSIWGDEPDQSVPWTTGFEPVAGYRLVIRIGSGGSGEVWEALRSGHVRVALKRIYLKTDWIDRERECLQHIANVRHSHLLSIAAYWDRPHELIIETELADGSLRDVLNQHRQSGIPLVKLLNYMEDAAQALDYLNHHADGPIQHRDVKPANLLIIGDTVKVADFGLAKILDDKSASHSGAMSRPYAAPEFFRGRTSDKSDQYSLAVTYFELRTGHHVFSRFLTDVKSIEDAHLYVPPDLSELPPAEAAIVERALRKEAHERWPNCATFTDQLQRLTAPSLPEFAQVASPASRVASNLDSTFDLAGLPQPCMLQAANPTIKAMRAALRVVHRDEAGRLFAVRQIETPAELQDLWQIDTVAYGDSGIPYKLFKEWWSAFPSGLWALLYGHDVVGGLGIWPLSKSWASCFKNGDRRECELSSATLRTFRQRPGNSWYISGIVLKAHLRNSRAIKMLLANGVRSWLETAHLNYPVELLALAYSQEGQALLERFSFTRFQNASFMPDRFPLYGLAFNSKDEFSDVLIRRGL